MNYFDDPNSKHFSFESFASGLDENTFGVINFKGYEAISETYDFEIMLVSSNKEIDLEEVLQSQAVFTIHRASDDNVLYNGIIAEFDQLHEVNDVIFYRARLVPKLWWLTLTHHNQVFLNQSVVSFVEDALRDGGLESADFDIGTLSGYEDIDYTCQYDESHFNFVSRWLERQGIYYYFTQESDGEVLVLTDTKFSHDALKQGADLFYNPASGLEGKHLGEAIGSFTCRQKQLPAEIILKDYNYERPSLDITSRADVDPAGRGLSYIYGEFFATAEEGERLATIRAEELLCQKQEFFGESTVPYIMPGFTFNLNNHYRADFNQEYLILEVTHEGNQSHLMSGGIATDAGKSQNQAIYRNTFKAIPNDVQYRPLRNTEKPKISGTIHAKVDDEQGRYRVKLPFDINDEHMDGKGSAPIRMMQPYAGKNRGMQFPLVKGTEVLLTFIEGNPDRPVIAGAVSNPETQGPVNAENLSESVIQTGGNNRIRMEDKKGSERMVFESPAANSWIRVGSTNDPITLNGTAVVCIEVGDSYTDQGAVVQATSAAITPVITKEGDSSFSGDVADVPNSEGVYTFTYTSNNASTSTPDIAIRKVYVGADTINTDTEDADGIRIRTAGVYWNEGMSREGDYIGGAPVPTTTPQRGSTADPSHTDPNQIGDLLANFGVGYNPTGLISYYNEAGSDSPKTFTDLNAAIVGAHVSVSSLDTFTTQEGNIYDFGGYWNYNLGNSYAEDHMDQDSSVTLNEKATYDLLNTGGPHFTSIDWPTHNSDDQGLANLIGSSFNDLSSSDTELPGTYFNSDGSTRLWVQKSFGNSYEYTEGDSISVSKGNSLEVTHGGNTSVEVKYNSSGKATYWSKSSGGITDEKKWSGNGNLVYDGTTTVTDNFVRETSRSFDRNTGDICSFSSSQGTGMGSASFEFDYSNKASASVCTGSVASTETYVGGKISNENYVGAKLSIGTYLGGKIEMSFAAAGVLNIENTEFKFTLPGLSTYVKTNVVDTKANDIKALATRVDAANANIEACSTNLLNTMSSISNAGITILN